MKFIVDLYFCTFWYLNRYFKNRYKKHIICVHLEYWQSRCKEYWKIQKEIGVIIVDTTHKINNVLKKKPRLQTNSILKWYKKKIYIWIVKFKLEQNV